MMRFFVICTFFAVAVFAFMAITSLPSLGNDVIHACAKNNKGTLRVVDNPTECQKSETALSWNETGPQGDPGTSGADGMDGMDGVDGMDGLDGLSGYEVVLARFPSDPGFQTGVADCPGGKVVLGGGVFINEGDQQSTRKIIRNHPISSGGDMPTSWRGTGFNDDQPWSLDVYAICGFPF